MSGPAWMAIGTGVLLDAALKATVVVGVGAVGARWLRHRPAALRHGLWAVTLGALPLIPAWTALDRGPELALDLPGVLPLWLAGVAVTLLPLVRGLVGLGRLRGRPLGTEGPVRILRSDRVPGPLTWGWWRPTVVLPAEADHWAPVHRRAALDHELAHVRRRDWLVHVLAHGVLALFWFHPLAWWAWSRLRIEAEHAADDAVLATGIAPSDYAELLVHLATPAPSPAALGAGSAVGQRVHAILAVRPRDPRRAGPMLALALLAALSVPALGSAPLWTAPEQIPTCDPGVQP